MTIEKCMLKENVKIFKALSDKNRVRILMCLTKKPLCVCELREILDVSLSTVSKHLSILRDAGFITDAKDGKWVNYKLNLEECDDRIRQMALILPMWHKDDPIIKSDLEKVAQVDRNEICNI